MMKSITNYISESKVAERGTWDYLVSDGYKVYDAFVDRIKNYYAEDDDEKARVVEDEIHANLIKMLNALDKKYLKM